MSFFTGLKKGMGSFSPDSFGEGLGNSIGALGSAAGGVVGNLISNGFDTTAGQVLNSVGDMASAIPGPWGAIAGAGAKILGGLTNAAFGMDVDQGKLNAANQGTNYLNSFRSTATYFDDVQGPQTQEIIQNPYRGGWFRKGEARRKNNALRLQRAQAADFANRSVENNIDNIVGTQMDNLLANYAAFGGPLGFGAYPIEGAIDYEFAQKRLAQKSLEEKKALGGALHTHGADWTNGITTINSGGTHEQNPFEGVPMGVAPDGQPNLVEEGEVIFNDYVFSNRLRVPKAVREKYKLRGQKGMTFADAAKKAQKESEERPNDPISKRGLEDIMNKLMVEQETLREQRQSRKYAEGGDIYIKPSKRGTFTAAASKHGMGVQEFASKVLANPEDYSSAMRKKANFARNASKWKHAYGGLMGHLFSGEGPYYNRLPKQAITGPDNNPSNGAETQGIGYLAPTIGKDNNEVRVLSQYAPIQELVTKNPVNKDNFNHGNSSNWLTGLRYVPAIGAGIGVFSDLMGWTNRPDYSNAQLILDTANGVGDVHYTPIGDYLRYDPFDTLFYANQLGAQAGATRRNIINTSGGNRGTAMAGLLSSDYNAQEQLGKLYRQAEEYNLGQRERVATFNRATNMFNSENDLKAQIANRENARTRIEAAAKAAAIRDAVDARVGAARSANLTNLFDSLGDIGVDAYNRQDRDMLIKAGVFGTLSQKPQEWSQKRWEDYKKALSGTGYRNGGILKKRKGITI